MSSYIGGCDVSEYQGDINWPALRPGTNFVIIKASDGETYVDRQFHKNQPGARSISADTAIGYYHFAEGGDPVKEAEHFLATVGVLERGEFLALDWEVGHPNPVGWCEQFIAHVKQRGYPTPLLYTNQNRVISYNWTPVVNEGCGLWVAHYGYTQDQNVPIKWWPFYVIHQTGSNGTFPGIGTRVDVDYAFATVAQLKAYVKHDSTTPAPVPVPTPPPPPPTTTTTTVTTTTTTTTLPPVPGQPSDIDKENNGLLKQILALLQKVANKFLSIFK